MDADSRPSDAVPSLLTGAGARPVVSMVLPVYNGERYLAEALQSMQDQTFTDWELIAVDDCSRDSSPQILAEFAARDPRIRVIRKDPNAGLPAALNTGFAAARGRYHSWTSDDNVLRPHMLARLVEELDARHDVGIVHSGFVIVDGDDNLLERIYVGPAYHMLFQNNIGASFLYRHTVTEKLGGYDEGLFGAEDYDFWLRAARHFTFHAIDDDLYIYRKHGGSLTNNRAIQIHRYCAQIVVREIDQLPVAEDQAEVLVQLVLRNMHEARPDLVALAMRKSPRVVMRHALALAHWAAAMVKRRVVSPALAMFLPLAG